MNATSTKSAPALMRMAEAIAKIRISFSIPIPEGYEDENGFHYGPQPARQKIAWPPSDGSSTATN